MNSFLIGLRNFVFTLVLALIGLYIVTLLQIQGTLAESDFSNQVIDKVIENFKEVK